MTTTSVPKPVGAHGDDPTRTGAVWVTGTGAFLLLAAAAVFTAVRWDDIPEPAKFASLVAATGAVLLAGRRLAAPLPATGSALFHLGTCLVPVDVAAIGIWADLTWPQMLLAQGAAATLTFGCAARVEGSVVLRWASWASAVLLAGGIGATTSLPTAVVLAGAAVIAAARRAHGPALAWSAVVGLAPLATVVQRELVTGAGTLDQLGLAPGSLPPASAMAALAAGATIGVVAHRTRKVDLALLGVVVALAGVATSWAGADVSSGSTAVALAAAFVAAQIVGLAVREDRFWSVPANAVAQLGEYLAVAGLAPLAADAVTGWGFGETSPASALSAALLALGWVVADRRRGDAGMALGATTVSACTTLAVALATTDAVAMSLTLAVVALAATASGRTDGITVGVVAASAAPIVGWGEPVVAIGTGLLGALTIAECSVRRSRLVNESEAFRGSVSDVAGGLALVALAPLAFAAYGVAVETGSTAATLVGVAVAVTALAAWIDRGEPLATGLPLGTMVRACTSGVLAGTAELPAAQVALVAAVAGGLSVFDAVRLRHPQLAYGAALSAPVAVGAFVRATGLSLPATGVAMTVGAVVVAGLGSLLLGEAWRRPAAAAVVALLGGGVLLAAQQPAAFAHALLVTGGLGWAVGVATDRIDVQAGAGAIATAGFWMRLDSGGVTASEPYLLPVVALLLLAGASAMAKGTAGSWVAYGPAIGLLGGSALTERVQGGPGWHAVLAGAVGIAAVVAGGDRRLAAPLVLGTVLLVALVGYESLAITAGLPTWVWLAAGGSALLGAGVTMERHEVGPLETGRRLVDVMSDRYR